MEPIMWLILLACFLVVEAITVGLTTIWFAGGALVAAIASGAGAGILVGSGNPDPVGSVSGHFTGTSDLYTSACCALHEQRRTKDER